ncbi:MAG: hypothetical protein AB1630_09955 [bacterium]
MYNPFFINRAENFTDAEVADFFVRNLVWDEVREPVNHIIYGAPGTGKSMILKRLSSESMFYKEDYLEGQKYIGVYLHISKVSNIFHPIFPHLKKEGSNKKEEDIFWFQRLFGHYLCIKILDKIINILELICKGDEIKMDKFAEGITIGLNEKYRSLQDIKDFCRRQEHAIEQGIPYFAISVHEHKPLFEISSFLDRVSSEIIKVYKSIFGEDIYVYLLFDESSATSIECQKVINIILQRGYPYRTKLAVRPYEWETLNVLDGPSLEIDSDFKLLSVEYLNKNEDKYKELLKDMANKMIMTRAIEEKKEGWSDFSGGIEYLLNDIEGDYSGFDKICKVSSGSILRLLLLCSEMFSVADEENVFSNGICPIRHQIQDKVIKRYSKEQVFWNIKRIEKGEGIKKLCQALLKKIKEENFKGSLIKIGSSQTQQVLFEDEFLEDGVGEKLKPAFTHGFFRFLDKNSDNFWRVPSSFNINKVLFPQDELGLEEDQQPLVIEQEFIEPYFQMFHKTPKKLEQERELDENKELSAFFSTSLAPYSKDQREAIKNVLLRYNIKCLDIEDLRKGQFLLSNIIKHIENYDFAIVDLTEIKPDVMLELGICAGLAKPVVCIFNQEFKSKIEDLPEWILLFSIIPYRFEPKELDKMASEIKNEVIRMWDKKKKKLINNEFIKTGRFGSSLRPPIQKDTIYLSYPLDRKDIWRGVYPKIENYFKNYRIINEDNAPFMDANVVTKPIFCASLAKYIFVDTTNNDHLQFYKLGVGGVMSKAHWTMRIEEERMADQKVSLWIERYRTWNNTDDLIALMEEFITSTQEKK